MKPPSPPPLSDKIVVERQCSRDTDWPNGKACGREPFLHCCWSVDEDGCNAGFVCTAHTAELDAKGWTPVQQHEMGGDCGMPGAVWDFAQNRCVVPAEPSAGVVTETHLAGVA